MVDSFRPKPLDISFANLAMESFMKPRVGAPPNAANEQYGMSLKERLKLLNARLLPKKPGAEITPVTSLLSERKRLKPRPNISHDTEEQFSLRVPMKRIRQNPVDIAFAKLCMKKNEESYADAEISPNNNLSRVTKKLVEGL